LVGFGVLQQQINLIRRFFSNVQTPDSVITPVTIDKDYNWVAHPPKTYWPVVVGIALVFLSLAAFIYNYFRNTTTKVSNGIDLNSVKEKNGEFWTTVNNCAFRRKAATVSDPKRPPIPI